MSKFEPPKGAHQFTDKEIQALHRYMLIKGYCNEEITYMYRCPWKYEHLLVRMMVDEAEGYANMGESA